MTCSASAYKKKGSILIFSVSFESSNVQKDNEYVLKYGQYIVGFLNLYKIESKVQYRLTNAVPRDPSAECIAAPPSSSFLELCNAQLLCSAKLAPARTLPQLGSPCRETCTQLVGLRVLLTFYCGYASTRALARSNSVALVACTLMCPSGAAVPARTGFGLRAAQSTLRVLAVPRTA